jgi:hypothetical protein
VAALTTVGAGAGCSRAADPPVAPAAPDVLLPLLKATIALADQYDGAITAAPTLSARLTPLRDDHRAHIQALTREIGLTDQSQVPKTSPSALAPTNPPDPAALITALTAAEKTAQADATAACIAAPAYRAALLGAIAACRATHLVALA